MNPAVRHQTIGQGAYDGSWSRARALCLYAARLRDTRKLASKEMATIRAQESFVEKDKRSQEYEMIRAKIICESPTR